jgi:hypothetical protein
METKYKKYSKIFKRYKEYEKRKKIVWSRYYLDEYDFSRRVDFILNLIQSHVQKEFVVEIKYWEDNYKMAIFLEQSKNSYSIIKEYKNGQKPGIIVINDNNMDMRFFENLLSNHYNFELACEPALSIKVLLFINYDDYLMIFDFYDDRGFIISYYFL